jgi:hypothetical protein
MSSFFSMMVFFLLIDPMTMLILDSMAYHEMRLIITRVLWNFDLKLRKESENWADQRVFSIWHKGPLMVEVKARAS